jgi:PAS domain S-box-containing protein
MDHIQKYFDNLIQNAGDAIFAVGKMQTILMWNIGAEELLGFKPDDIIGKNVDVLSPYENKRQMRSMVVEVFEEGTLKNLECELTDRNGRIVTVYVTASPIRDENENVIAVSIIAKDITDQNKLLLTLIEKEKRASHLEALVQSLTTISHYIRNSVAIISAKAEVSLQIDQAKNYHELVHTCLKETKRIVAVIESLNDMVRDVEKRDERIETTEMAGAPSRMIDVESRLKERLKKMDEENP